MRPGKRRVKLPAKSDRKSHRRPPGDARRGFTFSPTGQITCHKTGQVHVLVTCKRASLSGAMCHGFEGAISTFGVYFPYLNLGDYIPYYTNPLKSVSGFWSNTTHERNKENSEESPRKGP